MRLYMPRSASDAKVRIALSMMKVVIRICATGASIEEVILGFENSTDS